MEGRSSLADGFVVTTSQIWPTSICTMRAPNSRSRIRPESRLPIDYPSAWQVSGVGRAFHRHNPAEVPGRAVLLCCHVCQSIPQLRLCGTESRRSARKIRGSQKPRATLRRKIHAAHEALEAQAGVPEVEPEVLITAASLLQEGGPLPCSRYRAA